MRGLVRKALGKPNVYGSIFRFEGQATVFGYPDGPCYRCLYPEPPPPGLVPSCAEGGVLGVLPGIVGSIQAMETIKLILGTGEPLVGRLLLFDALAMRFRELKLKKNPDCPLCRHTAGPITKLIPIMREFCGIRGEEAPAMTDGIQEITATELKARQDRGDKLFILDVREPHEYQICNLNGKLIPARRTSAPRSTNSTVLSRMVRARAAAENAPRTPSISCKQQASRNC